MLSLNLNLVFGIPVLTPPRPHPQNTYTDRRRFACFPASLGTGLSGGEGHEYSLRAGYAPSPAARFQS